MSYPLILASLVFANTSLISSNTPVYVAGLLLGVLPIGSCDTFITLSTCSRPFIVLYLPGFSFDLYISSGSEEKKQIIEDYFKEDNHNEKIGLHCFRPYECPFFNYCTKSLPTNNVFNIRQMNIKTKFKLYNKGKYSYEDLQNEDINDKYKEQVLFSLNKLKPIIKKENIASFMSELTYPLYFLDFETFQQAIPQFDGVRPYMQIPFQYSLHYIESETGELKHKEFLAKASIDPRRGLAEKLVKDIPKDVCVLAYNMGFEKSVIKNLASLFPDLSNHLMNIYNNLKDLMIPFQKRDYVTKEMSGSYSIKYVLPALFPNDPSLDYHNLELVHKGDEASSFYANLHNYSKEEQLKIRTCLLKYCELDTFAMVKIWQKLNEIIKDN